jgi:hypothetical protein
VAAADSLSRTFFWANQNFFLPTTLGPLVIGPGDTISCSRRTWTSLGLCKHDCLVHLFFPNTDSGTTVILTFLLSYQKHFSVSGNKIEEENEDSPSV